LEKLSWKGLLHLFHLSYQILRSIFYVHSLLVDKSNADEKAEKNLGVL